MKLILEILGVVVLSLMLPVFACRAEKAPATAKKPEPAGLKTIEQIIADCREGIAFIGNDELIARMKSNPKLVLLDVRTKEEYDAGHLKGATWLERGIAEFTLSRTLRDPDAEIVVYCGKGNRSALVVKELIRNGYRNVKSHVGFEAWVDAGLSFHNFLGEAKMVKRRAINSATNPIDYYENKI